MTFGENGVGWGSHYRGLGIVLSLSLVLAHLWLPWGIDSAANDWPYRVYKINTSFWRVPISHYMGSAKDSSGFHNELASTLYLQPKQLFFVQLPFPLPQLHAVDSEEDVLKPRFTHQVLRAPERLGSGSEAVNPTTVLYNSRISVNVSCKPSNGSFYGPHPIKTPLGR